MAPDFDVISAIDLYWESHRKVRRAFRFDPMSFEPTRIGHWLNQSYVIRLDAILRYSKIIGDNVTICSDIPGHDDVDILRRLRNVFAKTSGRLNTEDSNDQRLLERMVAHFHLPKGRRTEWPLAIDTVLKPITDNCRYYEQAVIGMRR